MGQRYTPLVDLEEAMRWISALLLIAASCTTTAAGVKREASARFDGCMGSNVVVNADSRESCIRDALGYCNSQGFGTKLCSRADFILQDQMSGMQHAQKVIDAGDDPTSHQPSTARPF